MMGTTERIGWRQVVDYAGCSYRQFDYWCRLGVFGPEHVGLGSGNRRGGFTVADMRLARLLARVTDAGWGGGGRYGAVRMIADRARPLCDVTGLSTVRVPVTGDVTIRVDMRDRAA